MTKPVKIAITGKIGSGKSTISEILIKLGNLIGADQNVYKELKEEILNF